MYQNFYQRPTALTAVVVTTACLAYGGGVVMFWFHAVVRGEHGPAISDPAHWLLDSTLAFVGLLPAVVVIVPVAALVAGCGPIKSRSGRRGVYALIVGVSFAIVTGPGPMLHDRIAGAGTPLANAVTSVAGTDPAVADRHRHAADHSAIGTGALQVLLGVPVYIGSGWVAAGLVEGLAARALRGRATAGAVLQVLPEQDARRPAA